GHLDYFGIETLGEHFFQFITAPPRFCDMMIGENLAIGRDKKAGAEDVEMHFGPCAGEAEHGIVALVSERIAGRSYAGVVKRESTVMVAKGKHHVNETAARFVGLDDVRGKATAALELLDAPLYLT